MIDYIYFYLGIALFVVTVLYAVVIGAMGAKRKWGKATWFILLIFLSVLFLASVYSIMVGLGFFVVLP